MNEHKRINHPVNIEQYRDKKKCDDCDFEATVDITLKKHERDCHDTWDCSKSISPPPKRKKNQIDQHSTYNSEPITKGVEELISDMDEMELDEGYPI